MQCCGKDLKQIQEGQLFAYCCEKCGDIAMGDSFAEAIKNWELGKISRLFKVAVYLPNSKKFNVISTLAVREQVENINCVPMLAVNQILSYPKLLKGYGLKLKEGDRVRLAVCKYDLFHLDLKEKSLDFYLDYKLEDFWDEFEVEIKCRWFGSLIGKPSQPAKCCGVSK